VLRDCEVLCGYFPKALLRGAARLRWLQLPSAGADKYVDEAIYPHPGVILTNASGAFGAAIAEQLLMGALMLLRRMPEYQAQQQEKRWHRVGSLRFLRGSRVAILGTGNLGGTFGTYCQALGAHVVGVSRSGSPKEGFDRVYPMGDLLEAVRGADLVAACLPLTQETQGCIDRVVFQAMGPESIFLSVGRGKTVVQADLVEALETGIIYGAMLDVAEQEPMPEDCPLWTMDRVIITPHISGSDLDEANSQEIFSIFMDNLSRFFAGLPLHHIVDRQKGY
jgi:phosphoglycerate dehydrogenase-like enzyme